MVRPLAAGSGSPRHAGERTSAYHHDVDDRGNRTRSESVQVRREPSNRAHAWLFHVFSCDAPMAPLAAACDLDEIDEVALGRGELGAAMELDGSRRRLRLGFPDQWMSTRHARIERTVGGFWVADEGSKNGLLLNGERTGGALLVDGDWIEAGHTLLRYRHAALPSIRQPRDPGSGAAALATVLPVATDKLQTTLDKPLPPVVTCRMG